MIKILYVLVVIEIASILLHTAFLQSAIEQNIAKIFCDFTMQKPQQSAIALILRTDKYDKLFEFEL